MKKMYKFFSLEFHMLLVIILNFVCYLFPIAIVTNEDSSTNVVYGFLLFGALALVCGVISVVLMVLIDILPTRLKELWKYLLLAYAILVFLNFIYSLFYSQVFKIINPEINIKIGYGYIFQLIIFFFVFLHMYNAYHDDYILYNESEFKNFIKNNEENE